jgi:hypothetical protein
MEAFLFEAANGGVDQLLAAWLTFCGAVPGVAC